MRSHSSESRVSEPFIKRGNSMDDLVSRLEEAQARIQDLLVRL